MQPQPQGAGAATAWVSFDDDSGGCGFGFAAPSATVAAPVAASAKLSGAPAGWAQHFDVPASTPSAAVPAQLPAQVPTAPLGIAAPAAAAAGRGAARPPSSAWAASDASIASPPAAAPAPPASVFPSFAALHGGVTPAAVASFSAPVPPTPGPGPASPGRAAAPPADIAAALGSSFVQRLPRPPTAAARESAPPAAAVAANPFGSQAVPASFAGTGPPGASSNPFAASANPLAATAAGRSLDPFADLSLRPTLPRPPPMGASRSPTLTAVSAAAGPSPAAALGLGAGPAATAGAGAAAAMLAGAGPGLTATASPVLMRPPAAAPAAGPPVQPAVPAPAAAAPVSVLPPAPPSAFPSFAALYQQLKPAAPTAAQQPPRPVGAGSVAGLARPPAPTAAAVVVPPLPAVSVVVAGPQSPAAAAATPHASATRQGSGPLLGPSYGVVGANSFDACPPAVKSPTAPPHGRLNVLEAAATPPASPPPPPPYSVAVHLPDAAPPLLEGFLTGGSDGLPPPPYMEALYMPDAQPPPSARPPPPYDEAVDVEPSLGRLARPLPRTDTGRQPSATAFDDDMFGWNSAAVACEAPAAGLQEPASFTGGIPLTPARSTAGPTPLPNQMCVEVRLPPMKPKEAAWPKRLVAGMGLVFAAPGADGVAALQWWLQPGGGGGSWDTQAHVHAYAHTHGAGSGPRFALPTGAGAAQAAGRSTEDADSAPAASVLLLPPLSDLPPACCMLLDDISGSLWTGHKDGRVVRWSVEPGRMASYEHHWRAHVRGKITHMVLNPWGDLWTASSGGTIRAWQYQAGQPASRPPAKLFECRRCKVAVGPAARLSAQRAHSKARLMCVGPSGRVVWSAGRTGLALWNAYDGDFLGTISPEARTGGGTPAGAGAAGAGAGTGAYAGDTGAMAGAPQQQQMEINPQTGLDASAISRPFSPRLPVDPSEEADVGDPDLGVQVMKGLAGAAKLAVRLGKKIRQNIVESTGVGSTNEAGGGGEVASAGGSRGKLVALLPGLDSSVFVAFHRGCLEKYTEWGKLLWSRDYGCGVELRSAVLVGTALWLGCGDGFIRTASAGSGELGPAWKAHDFPVAALAHDAGASGLGSGLVYSLSENGSVRGWSAVPPSEAQRLAWMNGLLPSLRPHKLAVLAATWNVNETRPQPESLRKVLQPAAAADIVSVSLQEVEMGTSSVARDAAVTLLSKGMLERGNQNAQWWSAELSAALADTGGSWVRVALRQMSGLVVVVFCRKELVPHVGEVATANVACGVMGVGGNKGAVAVSMSVFRRRVMFVCSHFAAHQERVEERNDNYHKIVRLLHFDNTSKAAKQHQKQQQQAGEASVTGGSAFDSDADASVNAGNAAGAAAEDDGHGPGLSDAALLVWAGDFNYRLNGTYDEVREMSCTGALRKLFLLDQCRSEMEKGNVFRGLREPLPLQHPVFVPTYKYDKRVSHTVEKPAEPGAAPRLWLPFDSSEKQRVPAWTDRVFVRGSRPGSQDVAEEEVSVSISRPADYNCVLEVTDSDHKPVFALLQVQLPGYEQEQKRRHSLACALAVHNAALSSSGGSDAAAAPAPRQVRASASRLDLRPYSTSSLDIHNGSAASFVVHVMAEKRADQASGLHGLAPLPAWLEVSPTTFFLGGADGYGGGVPSQARLYFRVLGGDARVSEVLQLRILFRPLWGCETLASAPGLSVMVATR